jgi:hypothetical protein
VTNKIILRAAGFVGLMALGVAPCMAGPMGYTDVAAFDTAVASGFGALNVANFDSWTAGTLVPNGTNVGGGISLTYAPLTSGYEMDIISGLDTTSSSNYLGSTTTGGPTSEFDAFITGDQITMTFAQPEQAVGLFIIDDSSGVDEAGGYTLGVTGGSISNSTATDSTFGTLPDGGNVFFLGLVETDPTMSFTSATLTSDASFGVPFNIDDIVDTSMSTGTGPGNPVPDETSTLVLMMIAAAGLIFLPRLRRA